MKASEALAWKRHVGLRVWGGAEAVGEGKNSQEVVGLSYPCNYRKSHLIVSFGKYKAAISKVEKNKTSK